MHDPWSENVANPQAIQEVHEHICKKCSYNLTNIVRAEAVVIMGYRQLIKQSI